MAFGGAGIAISRGLAAKLERTLDGCLAESQTHWLDERLWGCVRPLGVEVQHLGGAHQMDIEGDMLGFLEAHPREPFVSMHHLHKVQLPISQSLIFAAMRADEARFLQRIACTRPLPPTREEGKHGTARAVAAGYEWIAISGGVSVRWWAAAHAHQLHRDTFAVAERTFGVDMGAKHQVQFNFDVRDKPLPPFRRFILSNVENDADAAATVSTYSVNDAYSMNDLRDGLDGQLRTVRVHAPTRAAGAGLAAPSCCERIAVAEGAADVFLSDDLNSCPSRDD